MFFSSINEINRLISKVMSNIYYWEKRSENFDFLGKKIWKNALALKNKKIQGIFGGKFILELSSAAVFHLQNRASDFFWFVLLGR